MRKYVSHKYVLVLSFPFILTYIPQFWIMPLLGCEALGKLPYLSEPSFLTHKMGIGHFPWLYGFRKAHRQFGCKICFFNP